MNNLKTNSMGMIGEDEQEIPTQGLTKREYFAAHAPAMPDWFKHESKLIRPNQPLSWDKMKLDEHLSQNDIELLKDWQHDPCLDLPDELKWYQEGWNEYHKARHKYDDDIEVERYFAWRWYYADQMLAN